jgi:Tfp pilus assembly protein PilP
MRIAFVVTVFAALCPTSARARAQAAPPAATPVQQPTQAQPAKPAEAPPAQPVPAEPPAENYSYRADGRRDPFQSLLNAGADTHGNSKKGDGFSGMTLGEISVRGIMQSRGALVAMIQGPDAKTYIVHQGDKLLDGTIKTITPQGLIVIQEVNDPLSLVKQREVRKLLRSLEDAK